MHALPPRVAAVPNAIAFRDPAHGVLGGGWTSCSNPAFGCRLQGTIQLTADGGRTWRVVLRASEPVVWVGYTDDGALHARLWDGADRVSRDGRTWRPEPGPATAPASPCPPTLWVAYVSSSWALCTGQGGAGSMGKAVYRLGPRGWRRVAYAPFGPPGHATGGIDAYGYPRGIAMARDGFGLIWEARGTLYVTRDGGSRWRGLDQVAVPEIDFGQSAAALPHGVGFVLLSKGGGMQRRLLETTDAGRTWTIVHEWR